MSTTSDDHHDHWHDKLERLRLHSTVITGAHVRTSRDQTEQATRFAQRRFPSGTCAPGDWAVDKALLADFEFACESGRCLKCADSPCSHGCPCSVDPHTFIYSLSKNVRNLSLSPSPLFVFRFCSSPLCQIFFFEFFPLLCGFSNAPFNPLRCLRCASFPLLFFDRNAFIFIIFFSNFKKQYKNNRMFIKQRGRFTRRTHSDSHADFCAPRRSNASWIAT